MNPDRVMGIDLGTTNSVAAILDIADRELLFGLHRVGGRSVPTLPSVVGVDPAADGDGIVVGYAARALRGHRPAPVLSVKRGMGTPVTYSLGETRETPSEISARILTEVARCIRGRIEAGAEKFTARRAVITVPAHFEGPEQEATTKAGELAGKALVAGGEDGLEVVELLREPVAAAIHYCWTRARSAARAERKALADRDEIFMVYDLGGGTFDVSIIRKPSGSDFQTLSFKGDSLLGGDNFDELIAMDLFQRVSRQSGVQIDTRSPTAESNLVRYAKLLTIAEWIKLALSDRASVEFRKKNVFADDRGRAVDMDVTVTQEDLKKLIGGEVERTIQPCRDALAEAGIPVSRVDEVLMVGGSSMIPLVQDRLASEFCSGEDSARCARPVVHQPTICVGAGAALKAASYGRTWAEADGGHRIHLAGYGSSAKQEMEFQLEVVGEAKEMAPNPRLESPDGQAVIGIALPGGRRALFQKVPLAPERTTFHRLILPDDAGTELAGFDLPLRHDSDFVEPVGLNTSANVLSYRLGLEILDEIRREPIVVELAARLVPLPNEFTHRFKHPGGTETLRLPLYGNDEVLKVVEMPVKRGIQKGAEVVLVVRIDGAQRVSCEGSIPEADPNPFPFVVEPPAPERVPSFADFKELEARADSLLDQVRDIDPKRQARIGRLRQDLSRAFDHGDEPKIVRRMKELRRAIDDVDPASSDLRPPLSEVEELINDCRNLLTTLDRVLVAIDREDLRGHLETNADKAWTAARATPPDRPLYLRCVRNLQGIHERLIDEYRRRWEGLPVADRAAAMLKHAEKLREDVAALPLGDQEREILVRVAEHLDRAAAHLASDPETSLRESREAVQCLDLIERRVAVREGRGTDGGEGTEGDLVWGRMP